MRPAINLAKRQERKEMDAFGVKTKKAYRKRQRKLRRKLREKEAMK